MSNVIDHVTHLAIAEHMLTGLRITNAMDQTLYDLTLFAGVDTEVDSKDINNNNDNDNNNDNNNKENNEQIQVNKKWILKEDKEDNNNTFELQQESKEEEEFFDCIIKKRSRRVHKYVMKHRSHFQTQSINSHKHLLDSAKVIANTITTINYQFAQTYSLE
jgi:hypothetical protein